MSQTTAKLDRGQALARVNRVTREWRAADTSILTGDGTQLWDIWAEVNEGGRVRREVVRRVRANLKWAVQVEEAGVEILASPAQL